MIFFATVIPQFRIYEKLSKNILEEFDKTKHLLCHNTSKLCHIVFIPVYFLMLTNRSYLQTYK